MRCVHVTFAAVAVLVLVMQALAIAKLARFGFASTARYASNWAWQLATLVYALLLTSVARRCLPLARAAVVVCWLPLGGIIAYVAAVVTTATLATPEFLITIFDTFGVGISVVSNELLHYTPLLLYALVSIAYRALIFEALYRAFTRVVARPDALLALVLYQLWGGPFLFFGVYTGELALAGTTPMRVYDETSFDLVSGGAALLLVCVLVVGSLLLACTHCAGVCTRRTPDEERLFTERIYESDFERELDAYAASVREKPRTYVPLPVAFTRVRRVAAGAVARRR